MAREEIRVDVVAEDDASDVLERIAGTADELETGVDVPVVADTGAAESDLSRLKAKANDAGDGIREIGVEADGAQNAMANMVGNTAQDMGELAGVSGTAGVALGQIAEFAADGNVALKNLVKVAGPMAALGIATAVISREMEKAAATEAFKTEQVQGWVNAMREGATLTEAIVQNYTEAGKVEALNVFGQTRDITADLAALNVTVEEYAQLARMGADQTRAWGDAQIAAGADAEAVGRVMIGAATTHANLGTAQRQARVDAEVFGRELDETADAADRLTAAYDILTGRLDDESSYLNAQEAIDAVNDAMADAMTATADYGAESEEAQDANRRLAQQLANSKSSVLDYAGAVAGIPPEQATEITALIDQGKFREAELRLQAIEQTRTARVNLEVIYGRNRPLGYPASAPWPPTAAMATTNVTVNLPRGMRGDDVVRSLDRYAARNGGRRMARR